jgi:hypothetical protein
MKALSQGDFFNYLEMILAAYVNDVNMIAGLET